MWNVFGLFLAAAFSVPVIWCSFDLIRLLTAKQQNRIAARIVRELLEHREAEVLRVKKEIEALKLSAVLFEDE